MLPWRGAIQTNQFRAIKKAPEVRHGLRFGGAINYSSYTVKMAQPKRTMLWVVPAAWLRLWRFYHKSRSFALILKPKRKSCADGGLYTLADPQHELLSQSCTARRQQEADPSQNSRSKGCLFRGRFPPDRADCMSREPSANSAVVDDHAFCYPGGKAETFSRHASDRLSILAGDAEVYK